MSSNKEDLDNLKRKLTEALTIFKNQSNSKIAQDSIRSIIRESIESEKKINFILMIILQNLNGIKDEERFETIKILSLISECIPDLERYLSKILTIFQILLNEENIKILPILTETIAEIISKLYKINKDDTESSLTNFDLLLGFCLFNLKEDKKVNQICGCNCLINLIQNSTIIMNQSFIKKILDTIIPLFEKPSFSATFELLECLINLIYASVGKFIPYSTVTLFKVLDFLKDDDWKTRKIAIDIIYTISLQCPDEIFPLKQNIIDFLNLVKSDQVKEVRDICLTTIKYLNGNEEGKDVELESSKEFKDTIKLFTNTNNPIIGENTNKESNSAIPHAKILMDELVESVSDYNNQRIDRNNIDITIKKDIGSKLKSENSRNSSNRISSLTSFKSDKYYIKSFTKKKVEPVSNRNKPSVSKKISSQRSTKEETSSIYRTQRNQEFSNGSGIDKYPNIQIFYKNNKKETQNNINTLNHYKYIINSENKIDSLLTKHCSTRSQTSLMGKQMIKIDQNNNNIISKTDTNLQIDIYKQIKNLSEKQVILIETIENVEKKFLVQMELLNENVSSLERKMDKHLKTCSNSNRINCISIPNSSNLNLSFTKSDRITLNSNIKELNSFKEIISINKTEDIISLLNELENTKILEIKKIPKNYLEDIISKLLTIITNSKYVHKVINILKNFLINIEVKNIRQTVKNSLLSTLGFIIEKKDYFLLTQKEISDIQLMNSLNRNTW